MRDQFVQKSKKVLSSDLAVMSTCAVVFATVLNSVMSGAADRFVNQESYEQACQDFSERVLEQFVRNGKKGAVEYLIGNKAASFIYPEYTAEQKRDLSADPPMFHAQTPSGYMIDARSILDDADFQGAAKGYKPIPRGSTKYLCVDDFPMSTTPDYP